MNSSTYSIAVHGGAGKLSQKRMVPDQRKGYEDALAHALKVGETILEKGGSAVEAVVAAVSALEDDHHFNAGLGAALCRDGKSELSASVMEGSTGQAGAIAGARRTKNPVQGAYRLLNHSHAFLVGPEADNFTRSEGLEHAPLYYFITSQRLSQWERYRGEDIMTLDHNEGDESKGTVGSVAKDKNGNLAAATSTGGLVNQLPGRVGDSPIIGAGTWAANQVCAISATGTGDSFARMAFARRVADLIELGGRSPEEAGLEALKEIERLGGEGGCLIIDPTGEVYTPFTSPHLLRAQVKEGEAVFVGIEP